MDRKLQHHFNALSADYATAIERCVPRYHEMLAAVVDYLPRDWNPRSIVELGCGSGNLSMLLAESFPRAKLIVVDMSEELLAQARSRLPTNSTTLVHADMRQFTPRNPVDLVTSAIALHHLTDSEKQALFQRVYTWLGQGGIFTYCDQFAAASDDIYQRHIANWRREAADLGATKDEWEMWMQHQRQFDHHASLGQQWKWLTDAGFLQVDCLWRHLLWTVVQARA